MKLRNPLLFLMVFLLAACAQLGIPQADTFNKKIAAAAVSIQTIYETGNTAYQAGKINDAEANSLVNALNAALASLKTAKDMHDTDPTGAETKLAATLTILTALQAYLVAHQGGSPS